MKLITLLGAAALTAIPADALAQGTPAYAKVIATQTCRYMREGMNANDAGRKAVGDLFPVFGADMRRDGFGTAASLIVGERFLLCPEEK